MAIDTTRQLIQQITNASSVGENTATRVGNAMEAMLNDVKAADDKAVAATNRINTTEQGIANANQRLTTEEGVNAEQSAQIAGLKQDLQNIRPVTIEGNVTNNPDNVFLTSANDEITPKERTTSLSAKGHYIMRPTDNFASKLKANYIHEIPFDVDLGGASVTIPANAVLKFTGGKIANGSLVLQNTTFDGDVDLGSGVTISGTINAEAIKQKWFYAIDDFIRSVNATTGYLAIEFAEGSFSPTVAVELNDLERLSVRGNGAKITWSSDEPFILINGGYSNYEELTLSAAASKGDRTITLSSASGVKPGDLLVITDDRDYSFSPYRANYRQGECAIVEKVAGNVVTLYSALYGNYTSVANTSLVKAVYTQIDIDGLHLQGSGGQSSRGIEVRNVSGRIANCTINNCGVSLYVSFAYDVMVESNVVSALDRTANVDTYGMDIACSQKVFVRGNAVSGGEQGISFGGVTRPYFTIPNREAWVESNIVANQGHTYSSYINFHGNSEFCSVVNNICDGIDYAGADMMISGNTIKINIKTNELLNYRHTITNNVIFGVFSVSSYAPSGDTSIFTPTTDKEFFVVDGNTMYLTANSEADVAKGYGNKENCEFVFVNNNISIPSNYLRFFNTCKMMMTDNVLNLGVMEASPSLLHFARNSVTFTNGATYLNLGKFSTSALPTDIELIDNIFNVGGSTVYIIQLTSSTYVKNLMMLRNRFVNTARFYGLNGNNITLDTFVADGDMVAKEVYNDMIYLVKATDAYLGELTYIKPLATISNTNFNYHYKLTATNYHRMRRDVPSSTTTTQGATANRPTTLTASDAGFCYYDTSINKPVFWNGSTWVDAAGTTV